MENLIVLEALNNDEATLNVTWNGQNGNLSDPVPFEATVTELKAWAQEAVMNGDIAGIAADPNVNLADFEVDRYRATEDKPYNSLFVRPKTAFGN